MSNKVFSNLSLKLRDINKYIGTIISYLTLILVLLVVYDVTLRYFFSKGSPGLQELEWHLFAVIFLIGISYTQALDKHVRVDVIYSLLGDRAKALINILGAVLFLLPFSALVVYTSYPFIETSYLQAETSPDQGGLSHRYIIKSFILIGFFLLFAQGIIGLIKDFQILLSCSKEQKGELND